MRDLAILACGDCKRRNYTTTRNKKTMTERLHNEILDASNGIGAAVMRREDTHKMAESDKAFAHYRW